MKSNHKFILAFIAFQKLAKSASLSRIHLSVKQGYCFVLETVCAKLSNIMYRLFKANLNIYVRSSYIILKNISFGLCFPIFRLLDMFLEGRYFFYCRRMSHARLCKSHVGIRQSIKRITDPKLDFNVNNSSFETFKGLNRSFNPRKGVPKGINTHGDNLP